MAENKAVYGVFAACMTDSIPSRKNARKTERMRVF